MGLRNPLEASKERPWLERSVLRFPTRQPQLQARPKTLSKAPPIAVSCNTSILTRRREQTYGRAKRWQQPKDEHASLDLSSVEMHWDRQKLGHLVDKCRSHN